MKIHGHHIVQKTIPSFYKDVKKMVLDSEPFSRLSTSRKMAWFIGKSHELLIKLDIPILEDLDAAMAMATDRQPLYNLCWAVNGHGTHTLEHATGLEPDNGKYVMEFLTAVASVDPVQGRRRADAFRERTTL